MALIDWAKTPWHAEPERLSRDRLGAQRFDFTIGGSRLCISGNVEG